MNKYFMCCEKCFECISRRNTRAAKFWMDLCAMSLDSGNILSVKTPDFPELRVLETMGFLLSTDKDDSLAIRIHGHINTESGEPFFCLKDGRHE